MRERDIQKAEWLSYGAEGPWGEGSVQDEAQGSGQGRDREAVVILNQGEGTDLGKMPKSAWDLVGMEYSEGIQRVIGRGPRPLGVFMSKGQTKKSLD